MRVVQDFFEDRSLKQCYYVAVGEYFMNKYFIECFSSGQVEEEEEKEAQETRQEKEKEGSVSVGLGAWLTAVLYGAPDH